MKNGPKVKSVRFEIPPKVSEEVAKACLELGMSHNDLTKAALTWMLSLRRKATEKSTVYVDQCIENGEIKTPWPF